MEQAQREENWDFPIVPGELIPTEPDSVRARRRELVAKGMASVVPGSMHPGDEEFARAVDLVSDRCWTEADGLGWHKSYEELMERVELHEAAPGDVLNWISSKLLLVVSEVVESQDEFRNGRDIKEVYYRDVEGHFGEVGKEFAEQRYAEEDGRPLLKPEGFLVEIADAIIRLNDLFGVVAGTEGVFLGPILLGKLQFNGTRGKMHGGKKF